MNNVIDSSAATQTPGKILKAARETRCISISEVAQNLLLSKKIITALEEDDYSKIVAQVYAEGYLKAYAKFLQVPIASVLESFRMLNVYAPKTDEDNPKVAIINSWYKFLALKKHFSVHLVYSLAIIAVLGVMLFWFGEYWFSPKTDIIYVPKTPSISENNQVISDNQMPIINPENSVKPEEKENTQSVTLMLDSKPTQTKTHDYGEPKLILTKPKNSG